MRRPHVAAKIAEFKGSPPAPEPGMSRSQLEALIAG